MYTHFGQLEQMYTFSKKRFCSALSYCENDEKSSQRF